MKKKKIKNKKLKKVTKINKVNRVTKLKKKLGKKRVPKKVKKAKVSRTPVKVTQDQVNTLLKKGEERGFLTTSEILYAIPNVEYNVTELERIFRGKEW